MHKAGGIPRELHYGVIAETLLGLHHAHELTDYDGTPLQIVHRDVTPHNIFVTYDGQVKVVDFGIAKAVGRLSETMHGTIKGKAPYMSPEQAQAAGHVDRRADIFSVGVMLWEAATQRRMWAHALDESEIIRSLGRGRIPASPRSIDPDVPEAIDTICRRALAFKPEERFSTAAEFEAELAAFLDRDGKRSSPRELGRFVSDLFVETRKEAKGIIDLQLAQVLSRTSASFRMVSIPPDSLTPSPSAQMAMAIRNGATRTQNSEEGLEPTRSSAELAPAGGPEDSPATRLPRKALWAGIVALGALTLGIAVWVVAGGHSPEPEDGRMPGGVVGASPASSSGDPSRDEIALSLRASPTEARFFVDEGPPLPNPFVGRYSRDRRSHEIVVKAPGYETMRRSVIFGDDVALQLSLAVEAHADAGLASPQR
jgi:serine/threonine-protein kinase